LTLWKERDNRSPLIVNGARQVGKTTLIQDFSKEFDNFIYLNLEEKQHQGLFNQNDDVVDILQILQLRQGIRNTKRSTLLFIDEIQHVPKAIQQLRYFKEKLPEVHVVAAGSLLEFALGEVKSFPVGRVEFMDVFPMNFMEFLSALDRTDLQQILEQSNDPKLAHNILLELFNEYVIVGGMPEILDNYSTERDLISIQPIYKKLTRAYINDFEKYGSNKSQQKILRLILNSLPSTVGTRIKLSKIGGTEYRATAVSEAFSDLEKAGLLRRIYPTSDTIIPAQLKYNRRPKLQFLDTGLLINEMGIIDLLIPLKDLNDHSKGKIVEHMIIQEIISMDIIGNRKEMFWTREKITSQAEIDIIYQHQQYLIPIEVKSGAIGKLKSLHLFMNQAPHHFAIRMYAGKFHVQDVISSTGKQYKLLNLPYYLGTQLKRYCQWFIDNHPMK